jgi:DNA-binding CsgD family transcriptional regulator
MLQLVEDDNDRKLCIGYVSTNLLDFESPIEEDSMNQYLPAVFVKLPTLGSLYALATNPTTILDMVVVDIESLTATGHFSIYEIFFTIKTTLSIMKDKSGLVAEKIPVFGCVSSGLTAKQIREVIAESDGVVIRAGGLFTDQDQLESYKKIISGDHSLPPKIQEILSGKKKIREPSDSVKLTTRQSQILNLIATRGASNKIIARTLNISESTVKLHMGTILKKYGVQNRTQLAVFSKKLIGDN